MIEIGPNLMEVLDGVILLLMLIVVSTCFLLKSKPSKLTEEEIVTIISNTTGRCTGVFTVVEVIEVVKACLKSYSE